VRIFDILSILRDILDYLSAFGKIVIDIEENRVGINIGGKWSIEIRSQDKEVINLIKNALRKAVQA